MRKLRPRQVKGLITSKKQGQNINPGRLDPVSSFFTTRFSASQYKSSVVSIGPGMGLLFHKP